MAKQFGDVVSEKHLQQIWHLIKEGMGSGIVTSEQYAWGYTANGKPLPITQFIDNPLLMLDLKTQTEMEKLGGGVTINGRITTEMINKVIPSRSRLLETQWIWRFSENIYYLVKGWIISK